MNLKVVQERKAIFVDKQYKAFIRSWSHLGPGLFEDMKRGRSPVKKKATIPPTPGPLILLTPLAPLTFRIPPQPERDESPPPQPERDEIPPPQASSQQQQRGGRGRGRGSGSGSGRGGRGGRGGRSRKEVVEKVVEEAVVEEEVVFSRIGRPIKPKKW